ncbi:MAG: hypothetical protein EA396_01055 [Anaerolineaceae bacterium]|nr:MAG: hypothetical protein EA396_01055 [Anaerolineaceae bacterium]
MMPDFSEQEYQQLSEYIDGTLPASERAALEARLRTDDALRAELDALRDTVALVRRLPALKAPRDFSLTPAMVGRPAQPSLTPPRRDSRRITQFPAMALLSAAASFIFIVLGAVLWLSDAPDTSPIMTPIPAVASMPTTPPVTFDAPPDDVFDGMAEEAFAPLPDAEVDDADGIGAMRAFSAPADEEAEPELPEAVMQADMADAMAADDVEQAAEAIIEQMDGIEALTIEPEAAPPAPEQAEASADAPIVADDPPPVSRPARDIAPFLLIAGVLFALLALLGGGLTRRHRRS